MWPCSCHRQRACIAGAWRSSVCAVNNARSKERKVIHRHKTSQQHPHHHNPVVVRWAPPRHLDPIKFILRALHSWEIGTNPCSSKTPIFTAKFSLRTPLTPACKPWHLGSRWTVRGWIRLGSSPSSRLWFHRLLFLIPAAFARQGLSLLSLCPFSCFLVPLLLLIVRLLTVNNQFQL